MEFKWINISETFDTGKTKVFYVAAKNSTGFLGQIKWYGPWRKYAFFPEPNTIFETDCLTDITNFIKNLMLERKLEKQKSKS